MSEEGKKVDTRASVSVDVEASRSAPVVGKPVTAAPLAEKPLDEPESQSVDNVKASVEAARAALSTGNFDKAQEALAPYLQQPLPPISALMGSGGIWWQIATQNQDVAAYGHAANAFVQVLDREPDRHGLQRRIAHCRLMQTKLTPADPRCHEWLDESVMRFESAAKLGGSTDVRLQMELGMALMGRGALVLDRADADQAAAIAVFRRACTMEVAASSDAAWYLQLLLRKQADRLPVNDAKLLRAEAGTVIARALGDQGNASRVPVWQASAIQAAIEEVRCAHPAGASRRMRLKEIQARFRSLVVVGAPIPILFSWSGLLCTEAEDLMGAARKAKYAEAEHALDLAGPAQSEQEEMELRLARARLSRQRGHAEGLAIRLGLLSDSEKALQPHLEHPHGVALRMEAACVALEQADLLRAPAAHLAAGRVLLLTESLLSMPSFAAEALHCGLAARLMLLEAGVQTTETAASVERLIELAAEKSGTWELAAKYALLAKEYEQASLHCESALRLGAKKSTLVPLWQRIDETWVSASGMQMPSGSEAIRRRMRLAIRA